MANTTNFNWETPDDTDLVKDGAAAIRTLGQAIDTSLMDLEGGTTDQVLAKNSNADMDFKWVTSDDANAIQNAIVDAKGDIVAASAADTPARLAVGTDNQRLVAASGETTGLKYVADTQNTVIDAAGDLVYGTAADTLGRLAIGTAGQVLQVNSGATAPEWATPAGGSSTLVLVKAPTSFSNVAGTGTTFDGVFTSTYTTYVIVIEKIYAATDTDDLLFNFRYAGPTTQTSFYSGAIRNDYLATTYSNQTSSNTNFFLHTQIGESDAPCRGSLTVQGVGDNAYGVIFGNIFSEDASTGYMVQGYPNDRRTYTGFLLKSSSSNITGTVAVYAYARS
jgi:hypothetical protein